MIGTQKAKENLSSNKSTMDYAPELPSNPGFIPETSEISILSTPIVDYVSTDQGFTPWTVSDYYAPQGFLIPDNLVDTRILESRIHIGYHKINRLTGEVYTGRTSGEGEIGNERDIDRVLNRRDRDHHMNKQGFGPAQEILSSLSREVIRGWEQKSINENGRAQSQGGTSGNKINGISDNNPKKKEYDEAFMRELRN